MWFLVVSRFFVSLVHVNLDSHAYTGLITDTTYSPFTTVILPYHHMDTPDQKIEWNVYSTEESIAR